MKEGAVIPHLLRENQELRGILADLNERVRMVEGRRELIKIEHALMAGVAVKKRAREDGEYRVYLESNFPGSAENPVSYIPVVFLMEYGVGCLARERDILQKHVQTKDEEFLFEVAKKQDEINQLHEQLKELTRLKSENERLSRDNGRLREERTRFEGEAQTTRKKRREDFVALVNGRIRRDTRNILDEALDLGKVPHSIGDKMMEKHRELFRKLDEEDKRQNGD
jgi:hypothetical protein